MLEKTHAAGGLAAATPQANPFDPEATGDAHFARFYVEDESLVEAVSEFVVRGVNNGAAGIVIATGAHLRALEERWSSLHLNVRVLRARGKLMLLDAAETLSAFMVEGTPDPDRFNATVGKIVATAVGRYGRAAAFGEMVSLLWSERNPAAAVKLESLWNELARQYPFTLFCGYSLRDCTVDDCDALFEETCEAHTHVIPAETFSPVSSTDQLRTVAQLQRKALTLEMRLARDKEVQRSLAHMAAIVECSDDAIISKTLDGIVQSWNAGAQRLFGYSPEEAIGRSIKLIVPPERLAEEDRILETIRRGERIEHFETTRVAKDGTRLEISLTISPVRNAAGVVIGASKIARNITARKRAERAAEEANRNLRLEIAQREKAEAALREASRRKDEFLALLAHELRNPLAPIRYALATNRRADRSPEQRRWAEDIIERQVSHMSRLLDDLLDVSRVTRGKLELKKGPTELSAVLGSAIETARPLLEAKHHTLSVDLPEEVVRLEADPVRLAQVFSNLLINAAKYTDPHGRIEVRGVREGHEVAVLVRDNGVGISEEMMPRLFTMFAQADTVLDRAEGGLGVGLALVRGLVILHGGTIEARSEGVGKGSEFVVRLPVSEKVSAPAGTESPASPAPGVGMQVLVVDDNRDAADTCAALLELSGHHVQTSYTGRRALELGETFRPHAILLDIGLPDINGYELATRIRAQSWGQGALMIAVTGWGQREDRRRALEAGFDHHLAKPIAPETLEALLQSAQAR
jgi:PAS domain S-box-containing protein